MYQRVMRGVWLMIVAIIVMALGLEAQAGKKKAEKEARVVAYVTSWSGVMPDPFAMTNINYAFGHVNDTFDGVRIDNPDRLKGMAIPMMAAAQSVSWHSFTDNDFWLHKKHHKLEARPAQTPLLSVGQSDTGHKLKLSECR